MKIATERLKQRLAAERVHTHSNRRARFLDGLQAQLTKPAYGPDGLIFACEAVFADPENGFENSDRHEFMKLMPYLVSELTGTNFLDDLNDAITLWLRSPKR